MLLLQHVFNIFIILSLQNTAYILHLDNCKSSLNVINRSLETATLSETTYTKTSYHWLNDINKS